MKTIHPSKSFIKVSRPNSIYVDKTESIYNLLCVANNDRVLISRPRRFGKSLTLDTIGTLFKYGVEPLFRGTWIYDHWDRNEGTYPVLALSFLQFPTKNFESFVIALNDRIARFAATLGIDIEAAGPTPADVMLALIEALRRNSRKIVILIDEYDCVLTHNIDNPPLYTRYTECLKAFYGVLKGKREIRFLGIAGVTRLKDVSIFSVGSDIVDITYNHATATLIGYTREEILKNFQGYITPMVKRLYGIDLNDPETAADLKKQCTDSLLERLAFEYDGYCFDEKFEHKVFNTWSVNRFFIENFNENDISFGDYWFDNGGTPSILANFLSSHELDLTKYTGMPVQTDYDAFKFPTSLLDIDPDVLMAQTGYLTLRSPLSPGLSLQLGIPNREIRTALSALLYIRNFGSRPALTREQVEILKSGDGDGIMEFFNRVLNSVSYEKFPIRDEASVRSHLQLFLLGARLPLIIEKQSSKGRSDIELDFIERRVVIELKCVKTSSEVQGALEAGLAQIKTRDYGHNLPLREQCVRLAMVYDASPEVRAFVKWSAV